MVKAAKAKQKTRRFKVKKSAVAVVTIVLLCVVAGALFWQQRSKQTDDPTTVRNLVFLAIDNLKTTAPVDAKTGYTYFPQAGLYLPKQLDSIQQKLAYTYIPADSNVDAGLSISSNLLMNNLKAKAYSAQSSKEFFDQVPHIQSCSRGVVVSYKQLAPGQDDEVLRHTLNLNNGKTAYLYSENACPELNYTLSLLKDLQSY
jgi:nitrogen fixation-related uncharacterized protein